jgi:hypothetical protein
MNADRYVGVYFCDDVRLEVGNKFSLMGCYSGELIVPSMPTALPKLCAEVRLVTPIDRPFEKAILRAYLNDEVVGELDLPVQEAKKKIPVSDGTTKVMTFRAIMNFSPFMIEREGALRIEVETEEGALKGGRLKLLLQETYQKLQAEAQSAT